MDEGIKELTLLLIYLSGWEEDSRDRPGTKVYKAWKGYLFQALDELEAKRMIMQHTDSELLLMTKKGKREAQKLKSKYLNTKP